MTYFLQERMLQGRPLLVSLGIIGTRDGFGVEDPGFALVVPAGYYFAFMDSFETFKKSQVDCITLAIIISLH
jgi:hypothetical protein